MGGTKFEEDEPNPMIGFRGAGRYIENPDIFKLEIEALKIVRNKKGFKNVHLMIPFIRTVSEYQEIKRILAENGLSRSALFKIWLMVEVPSTVILLDEFIDEGIDGVSIGSNDLTMLILGVDRDNYRVSNIYDENNEAVLWALEKVIKTCVRREVPVSICGQAPSEFPELVSQMVDWGVTSVSVNPDAIEKTRENIFEAERKLLINSKKYSSIEEKRKELSQKLNILGDFDSQSKISKKVIKKKSIKKPLKKS